jgi:plasmid stabilization system protein ParE
MSTYYAPDGTNLTDVPEVRSRFQQAIGVQNLERELDKLSKDPKIIASMEKMYEDIRFGRRGQYDARDYYHNIIIKRLFDKARKTAWRSISVEQKINELIKTQEAAKELQELKKSQTANLLNIYK